MIPVALQSRLDLLSTYASHMRRHPEWYPNGQEFAWESEGPVKLPWDRTPGPAPGYREQAGGAFRDEILQRARETGLNVRRTDHGFVIYL